MFVAILAPAANASAQEKPVPPPLPAAEPAGEQHPPPADEAKAETTPAETTWTSAEVSSAPKPKDAHSRVAEPSRKGEGALWIPRILLFPLRVVGEIVTFPIYWGLYSYEAYSLGPRVKSVFFNEDGTVGIYPTAFIETGFGLNVGGRLILRRLIKDVGLTARAGYGGRFSQIYSTSISTRDSFDRFELELDGVFEIRPKDRFYGIGNGTGDVLEDPPAMPLDPFGGNQIKSVFKQDALRIAAAGAYQLRPRLKLRASAAINYRSFDDGEDEVDERIETNFQTDALAGYDDSTRTLYSELELTYDSRRPVNRWESKATPATGYLLQAFAGYTLGVSDDPARYIRYGADLQRIIRLAAAPRTLALRLFAEGVTGSYDEVSFYDLPLLGGPLLLRGYDRDQFRDRVSGLASAEYQFDAIAFLSGFVFADAGRVFSDVDELEFDGMRLGFGGGIQFHTSGSFLGRFTVATSKDGGFFLTLSFDPVYDVKARVERK